MTKREIILHYPITDNTGQPMHRYVEDCIATLAKEYGGASVHEVSGVWYSPKGVRYREHCKRVILAIEPVQEQAVVAAFEIDLRTYNQEASYWVDTFGGVHIDALD